MSEDIGTSLSLMGTGMITVFLVLSLVIFTGNVLITLVNRFIPANDEVSTNQSSGTITSPTVVQAIEKAIDQVTDGRSRVIKIEKAEK